MHTILILCCSCLTVMASPIPGIDEGLIGTGVTRRVSTSSTSVNTAGVGPVGAVHGVVSQGVESRGIGSHGVTRGVGSHGITTHGLGTHGIVPGAVSEGSTRVTKVSSRNPITGTSTSSVRRDSVETSRLAKYVQPVIATPAVVTPVLVATPVLRRPVYPLRRGTTVDVHTSGVGYSGY